MVNDNDTNDTGDISNLYAEGIVKESYVKKCRVFYPQNLFIGRKSMKVYLFDETKNLSDPNDCWIEMNNVKTGPLNNKNKVDWISYQPKLDPFIFILRYKYIIKLS